MEINKKLKKKYDRMGDGLEDRDLPTTMHWIPYLDSVMCNCWIIFEAAEKAVGSRMPACTEEDVGHSTSIGPSHGVFLLKMLITFTCSLSYHSLRSCLHGNSYIYSNILRVFRLNFNIKVIKIIFLYIIFMKFCMTQFLCAISI